MKSFRTTALMLAAVLVASVASALSAAEGLAQGSRGSARISGKVTDESGKTALIGVEVRAQKLGEAQVLTTKTNDKGEWAFNGLAAGQWNFDFVMDGLETVQRTTVIAEGGRMPAMNLTMKKAEPKEDPTAFANRELQNAEKMMQAGQFAAARKVYTDLLVKFPDVYQLHINMGRAYAMEGNNEKATEHFKQAVGAVRPLAEKEPANEELKTVLAFLLQNIGESAEAAKLLQTMDVSKVKDPVLFINAAIHFINSNQAAEAVTLLDKLVTAFPGEPTLIYYRGRAYLAASKWDQAKADFEKFVAANPATAASEVAEAKKMLDQMSKIKK